MSRALGFLVIGLAALSYGQTTSTAPATRASDELLKSVQQHLRTVETVESDFVQEKNLAVLNHTLTIRGHFALEKPARVVWIVREPVRYAVRVDGEEVRQWDEDTNKVQVIHLGGDPTFKAISDQIQGWLLGNYDVLSQTFDVEVVGQKPLELGFTPKAGSMAAKLLKRVDLTFGAEDRYIDTLVVTEAAGSVTTLKFIDTHLNEPIAKETWEIPPHER